jgi:hypothetical protein
MIPAKRIADLNAEVDYKFWKDQERLHKKKREMQNYIRQYETQPEQQQIVVKVIK